jgi:hypothetical protein
MQRRPHLRLRRAPRGHAPYVRAEWLEETVWADVRQFLRDPGAVLERVREQMGSGGANAELEKRRADLSKRLAGKHKERDRWLHLYAQGHISDAELETHLTDLRAQIGNLTLLLESVEDELKAQREYVQVAETTESWLLRLKARVEEIEGDSPEYGRHSPVHVTLLSSVAQALPAGNSNSFRDSGFISAE